MDDSKHLLNLDVLLAITTGTFDGEPLGAEMAAEAFEAAGVCVDVNCFARWRIKTDPVPLGSETKPPSDGMVDSFGNAATREVSAKLNQEVVQCTQKWAGGRNDLG